MNHFLFIQRKAHRAGAQSCLERLLRFKAEQGGSVTLLCGEQGWLTEACERAGVRVLVEPFPKSRSLMARLFGNDAFARRVEKRLRQSALRPGIVHANDHNEGLLGLAIARRSGARTAIFLRSSAMTRRDYFKYGCDRYGLVIAVGEVLQRLAKSWDPPRRVSLVHDGIFEREFSAPRQKPVAPPQRVLVIGNAGEAKGWGDLADALAMLEARGVMLPAFDFTGDFSEKFYAQTLHNLGAACTPLPRTDNFKALVRSYDLAINPSRNESFGMAAIETLAAGVPLLSSRVGVLEQVLTDTMLFPAQDPAALARALESLLSRWSDTDLGVAGAQELIRNKFLIERTAAKLDAAYRELLAEN